MAPSLCYFGDIHTNPWNNFRIYGTCLVIFLTLMVGVGVKFVAYFAPVALICVMISIGCVFVGGFEANDSTRDVWYVDVPTVYWILDTEYFKIPSVDFRELKQ